MALPAGFAAAADEAWALVRATPGHLTEREARFLMLLAAATPGAGLILEIGSFKGKSTVALATIARRFGLGTVVAVDPHSAPSVTDPDLQGQASSYDDFVSNVRRAGVSDAVDAHRAYSRDVAREWRRPIRVLWIDGDHTYAGAKQDLDGFRRHLVPGAVVALHDVLHTFDGPIRVFVEELLDSDAFGPAGVCGSIGWAQYRPKDGAAFAPVRRRLARRAAPLVRLMTKLEGGKELRGWLKLRYKLGRARIPHGDVAPAAWAAAVALPRA